MSRLLPPTDDNPASMLRYVRGVDVVMIPLGVVVALILRAEDLDAWWLGLGVSALGILGLATIGRSIRRAEAHGPNDPETKPDRMRRAIRLTGLTFGVPTVIALVVALIIGDAVLAITFAVILTAGALGLWLAQVMTRR
jgi:hypothetical protein